MNIENGWLVGCFWVQRPSETVFQSISGQFENGIFRVLIRDSNENTQHTLMLKKLKHYASCPGAMINTH